MLQQVMTAPGKIEFREIETPVPKAGEVLIRIMKIGVCGSDIHVWHGKHPFTSYPVTQGHEVSGEIKDQYLPMRMGRVSSVSIMRSVSCFSSSAFTSA